MKSAFIKYSALAIAAQLICCVVVWLVALISAPALDSVFERVVFLYWPTIILMGKVLGTEGESAMIAIPVYGIALGIVLYSALIALTLSYVKKRSDARTNAAAPALLVV